MTAEIGILNPMAVALAADSAVTISATAEPGGRTKIYNSANKLFSLSKFHPVGIMVYGNAALMGFPWETIIKVYRQKLGNRYFDHLNDYCDDFFAFLENDSFISETWQEANVFANFTAYLDIFIQEVSNEIEKAVEDSSSKLISELESQKILTSLLGRFHKNMQSESYLVRFDKNFVEVLRKTYLSTFLKVIEEKFTSYPLTEKDKEKLIDIGVDLFAKPIFSDGISGVVIAGFGQRDFFPSLKAFDVECIVANRVKARQNHDVDISLEKGRTAVIVPFAQKEVVDTFIGGINPSLDELYSIYLNKIFDDYPKIVAELVESQLENEKLPKSFRSDLIKKLAPATQQLFGDFQREISKFKRRNLINPIVQMAAYLPKDELAAMAEALVNLTSFKRRISTSDETVGEAH